MNKHYTIGIDFGTLSARAVILDVQSGSVLEGDSQFVYPHGVFHTPGGDGGDPDYALEHPADYIDALVFLLRDVVEKNRILPSEVEGIGLDFTSCTLLPVDRNGEPLCMDSRFAENPHAYVKLWKHHSPKVLTDRLEHVARECGESFLERSGGKISCEFMIPKLLETLTEAPEVYEAADRFMNAGDYLVRVLTGNEVHSAAFAAIKGGWDPEEGFPSNTFFASLDSRMENIVGTKIFADVSLPGTFGGGLSAQWAEKTGLPAGTAVAVCACDAHAPMALAGDCDGVAVLAVGTSGCLCVNTSGAKPIPGVMSCGRNAFADGMMTYDAGLCSVGDLFDWFVRHCVPAAYEKEAAERGIGVHALLREKAEHKKPGENHLIALDWWNGNRCVLADSHLSGMILGLTLDSRPEDIYRALIEATAYGIRKVYDNYTENGVTIRKIVATGGIAQKDPMLMQIYADVLNRELFVLEASQSTSLGSAILATVASGRFPDIQSASVTLEGRISKVYTPIPENVALYETLYREYLILHDYFGRGGNPVMRTLEKTKGFTLGTHKPAQKGPTENL